MSHTRIAVLRIELSVHDLPAAPNERVMKMATIPDSEDELLPEYDLSQLKGGIRGKYYERYQARPPLVRLDPDVALAFPTEASVNSALRLLAELARVQTAAPAAL